jgi:thioesterase domain-containing protein
MSLAEAERLFVMYRTTREAMDRYVPRPHPGRIVAYFAAEGADQEGVGSAAGWENVAEGGVEVERIAGDHYSILRPPMVAEVAARLAAKIQALGGSVPR